MDFKDLKNKTWIDWVKVLVAVDIAFVGFGLILDQELHILSHIFGFISRIPFGVMYIFIAVLILKRVFPNALHIDPKDEMDLVHIDHDMEKSAVKSRNMFSHFVKRVNQSFDRLIEWIDRLFDRIANFFERRHGEVKQEIYKIMEENEKNAHSEKKQDDNLQQEKTSK